MGKDGGMEGKLVIKVAEVEFSLTVWGTGDVEEKTREIVRDLREGRFTVEGSVVSEVEVSL